MSQVITDPKSRGTVIIHTPASSLTPEQIVRGVFGISLDELVKEMRENRDGKYDKLYSTERVK